MSLLMIYNMKKIFLSALLMIMPMIQLGAKVDPNFYIFLRLSVGKKLK